jgi:signal transduction histidine kinase/CheY-like chemotaxis protein
MTSVAVTASEHSAKQRKFWRIVPSVFIGATVVITAVAGTFSYIITNNIQTQKFKKDYATVSEAALVLLKGSLDGRFETSRLLATILSNAFRDADRWPFAYLYGFDDIAGDMHPSAWIALSSLPIVWPSRVEEFEPFAYDQYARTYPGQSIGVSEWGKGIFSLGNDSTCFTCDRYHDTSGQVTYDSPYRVLTPVLQSAAPYMMMCNLHSSPERGRAIDEVIACAHRGSHLQNCGALTEPIYSLVTGQVVSNYFHPVYPALNHTVLVGFTATVFVWSDVLRASGELNVSGLQFVVKAGNVSDTYTVSHGTAKLEGRQDLHSARYDSYAVQTSVSVSSAVHSLVPNYTVVIYPTEEFEAQYHNGTAGVICAVVVAGVLVLSALLASCIYFAWVRRANIEAMALSRAKRQFVRYISHEIRTPLNTMSLGLNLLVQELKAQTGNAGDDQPETKCALELHTPPATAEQSLEVMGPRKCKEWMRLVNELIENSQCAVLLLDDLLCFEQLDCGDGDVDASAPPTEIAVLPAWELLNKALQEFDVRVRLSGVQLDNDCEIEDTTLPPGRMARLNSLRVLGNESQLKRIISNLLSNALHYSQEGCHILVKARWVEGTRSERQARRTNSLRASQSPPHTTDVSWLSGGRVGLARAGVLHVEITDQGGGLTAEQTAQVFGKGSKFRFSKLQAGQCSGIALFVCKLIAEHHHASIEVVSEGPGHGSTYVLEVPAFVPLSVPRLPTVGLEGGLLLEGAASECKDEPVVSGTGGQSARSELRVTKQVRGAAAAEQHRGKQQEQQQQQPQDVLKEDDAMGPQMGTVDPSLQQQDAPETKIGADIVPPVGSQAGVKNIASTRNRGEFRNKRILVVDDAPSNRKMLVRVLAKSGHVCDQAQDGQMAVDMVRKLTEGGGEDSSQGHYDMVLMDFEMPVMNGPTATRVLREMGCLCPIVGVTGNVLGADVDYFLAQGADAVLPKPLQLAALEEVWYGFADASESGVEGCV